MSFFNGKHGRLEIMLSEMIKKASRTNQNTIRGNAMGPKPKYFIVGDEPGFKDFITQKPFSGPLSEVMTKCLVTLGQRYGAKPEDCYATYLIKTSFEPSSLTEDMVSKEWLPIAQLEYYLSGCEQVVCIGRIAKLFAGHIATKPELLKDYVPSWKQKLNKIMEIVRS